MRHAISRPASSRWFAVLLLVGGILQAATAIARPMASYKALEIGMKTDALGLVGAAFAIGPMVFALSIGRMMDRVGEGRFTALAAVGLAAGCAGIALSTAPAVLLLTVALVGLAQLVFVVANQTAVATHSEPSVYDARFGSLAFTASVGQMVGPLIAGFIASRAIESGVEMALLVAALLAVAASPISLLARRLDPDATAVPPLQSGSTERIATILQVPGMRLAMLASVSVLAATDVVVVFLPAIGVERGLGPETIGLLLAVMAASSMASRTLLGSMTRRIGRQRLLVISLICGAVAVGTLAFLPLPMMFAMMALAGLALGVSQPLTMAWVATLATPGALATSLSLRLFGNRLGQAIIPLAAAALVGALGTSGVLAVAGIAVGVSAAVTLVTPRVVVVGSV